MKIAYVFPGQGSQCVGMGVEIAERYSSARSLYDRASAVLGFNLLEMSTVGPKQTLLQTKNAQPLILVASIACLAALESEHLQPALAAGLSLGEYTALVAAKALEFEDAVFLVRQRGLLMQEATAGRDAAMAAIKGLDATQIEDLCKQVVALGVCEPANYNSLSQTVVGGDAAAVEQVTKLAYEAGASGVVPLAVSAAFHTHLMQPVAESFAEILASVPISDPLFPVITNVTAQPVSQATEIRQMLIRQVANPVLWVQSVQRMVHDGIDTFIEFGPGRTLSNLIKRTVNGVQTLNVEDPTSINKTLQALSKTAVCV